MPACFETSSNVPLYPRKRRKQQWAIPSTSCPSFSLGCARWPLPKGTKIDVLCLSAQTACRTGRMPVLAWPCCRWPCRYVHSHLQLFDSWLPCSCPDTQPSAAGDFVTCRFHFSSVHHRKVFPGKRQWILDPSLGRWRWPLRTTRHIHAQ